MIIKRKNLEFPSSQSSLSAKKLPGPVGIFFDRSRHVECVIMMTNGGLKGKCGRSATICSGFGAKNGLKTGRKTAITDPAFWSIS